MSRPSATCSEIPIRALADGDVEAIVALWERSDLLRPWNDPRADIALARTSPGSEIFVAHDGASLLAAIMAGSDGHRGWLYYLAVEPGRRRDGLGRDLVRYAEEWLLAQGVPKVQLMIRAENEAVREFYERIGYEVEARIVMSRRFRDP